MPRQLFEDPFAAQAIELLQGPARARAEAVRQVADAQARAATTTGNANANAQIAGGNAWAGAAQQVGQAVGNIPSDIARAQQESQRFQLGKLQAANMTQEMGLREKEFQRKSELASYQKQIGQMMLDPNVFDQDTGLLNAKAIGAAMLKQQGSYNGPGEPPDLAKIYSLIDPINEHLSKAVESKRVAAEHTTNTLARMAATSLEIGKNNGGNYFAPAQLSIAALLKSGQITQDAANQMLVPMIENKDQIPTMLQTIAGRSTLPPIKLGKDDELLNPLNPNQVLAKNEGEPKVPTEASLAADLSSPDPAIRARAVTAMNALKPPKPTPNETRSLDVQAADALAHGDMETYNRLLKVKKEMGQADDRPRITVNTGPNANTPGDWTKTGKDFLSTIPTQWQKTVEKIANYDEDPTKVASMRGGMRETLSQWVNQVNPDYDASQFTIRAPTKKAFTTGTQGQQINAINTALGHIDQLDTLIQKLGNGSFTPGNKAWNSVRTIFGSDAVTNFDTLKSALSGEVASVLSKSGATVSGINEAEKKMSAANSPEQLLGYVKTQIPIMGSKLASLDYQYHQAMGAKDSFSSLSPESKNILTRMGFDPSHPAIGGGNGATAVRRYNPATGKVE